MNRPACLAVGGALAALLGGLAGCSTTPPDDGSPVPDPGGPFHASVASSLRIDGLTLVEADTLCRDLANANYAFLSGAIDTTTVCREVATTATAEAQGLSDAGFDADGACSQELATCALSEPPADPFLCPIPIPDNLPQQCDATVEDVSACLNETAAYDPVGTCVKTPGCDGGAGVDASAPPPSALPACERLRRICPALDQFATFPC